MRDKILRLNLYLGLGGFVLSTLLLILGVDFMKTWYYCFAWWFFILFLDSVNMRRTGKSPLSVSVRGFFFTAYLSVLVWLTFEIFNLRLNNWSYLGLPENMPERWAGYFVAFASVIPALKELSQFFTEILRKKRLSLFRIRPSAVLLKGSVLVGLLSLLSALVWPRMFFPLVWLGFLFVLEPINFWLQNDTLLQELTRAKWIKFWSWALAGLTAGFLWELWNFWAGSHWEYSLPYLDFGRVFHMPVLGYTGFMPFALEIFALFTFLSFLKRRLRRKRILKVLIGMALGVFCIGGFYLIDRFTLIR